LNLHSKRIIVRLRYTGLILVLFLLTGFNLLVAQPEFGLSGEAKESKIVSAFWLPEFQQISANTVQERLVARNGQPAHPVNYKKTRPKGNVLPRTEIPSLISENIRCFTRWILHSTALPSDTRIAQPAVNPMIIRPPPGGVLS